MGKHSILLIGAGQLGSRHLQALALLEEQCAIYVIDPQTDSLLTAKTRFEEIKGHEKHSINYYNEINNLNSDNYDLAIIATSANVRSKIIRELLQKKNVKYLILEKVLFQTVKEYAGIGELIEKSNSKVFVNCPRRMSDFYNELKTSLDNSQPIQMEIIGNNWGMGCNSIHFIDLFNYLTGDNIISWQNNLDKEIIESKRSGYKEFTGTLLGRTIKGNSLSLTCFNKGATNVSVRISSQKKRYVIEESFGKAWKSELNKKWSIEDIPFSMNYQSNLTQIVAKQLLKEDTCKLTPFVVSSSLHIPFIKTLLVHYNKYQEINSKVCPIT